MVRYFKSANRLTAVTSNGTFIQVKKLNSLQQITYGSNPVVMSTAMKHDSEITQDDWLIEVEEAIKNVQAIKKRFEI